MKQSISLIAGKKFILKGLYSRCQSNRLFMIENGYLNLSVDCMNSIVDINKALLLSTFSFSLLKSKYLVIDKSFCCKILDSMKLIFLKKPFSCTTVIETVKKKMACRFDLLTSATNRV